MNFFFLEYSVVFIFLIISVILSFIIFFLSFFVANQIGGTDLQNLGKHLDGIYIRKEGGLLYSSSNGSKCD